MIIQAITPQMKMSTSNKANSLQQQHSAEQQANLAQQQAQQQLDDNLKTDNRQANKSTEAQSQNDGQGTKPDKVKLSDPNISGKHVTRNERTDNMQSENSRKDIELYIEIVPINK